MKLDLRQMPFSRFGSYLTVMEHAEDSPRRPAALAPGIWLSGVQGFHAARETFRIGLWRDGHEVRFHVEAQPSHLVFRADGGEAGEVELCIAEPDLIRFRCRGVALRLTLRDGPANYALAQPGPRWLINTSLAFLFHTVYPLAGDCRVEAPGNAGRFGAIAIELNPPPGGVAELALHAHVGFAEARAVDGSFDDAVRQVAAEFARFYAPYRPASPEWEACAESAAFLNWSCVVGPRGHFQRPSMLMSKNWMCNVWSWDHAINALALSGAHPDLAWDQLLTVFDQQLATGELPDFINDAVRLYNYVKPPVHGWLLGRMLDRNAEFADPARLAAFYEPLERWTEWWLRFRTRDGLGLPEYYHGNDSGWDNATVFDAGMPAVAGDLAAFLVLQMETLVRLARLLGRPTAAAQWAARADALLQRLLAHLWDGRHFVVLNREGRSTERADSIYGALPIVLGHRLPAAVRTALIAEVRRHLTEWGLATEHPQSPLYKADGYWRGPIWAPPTLIVVDGLHDAGEPELADDIARRFCRLCRHADAFAENFDAVTGAPLCDKAYTWTSSVFLEMLAHGDPAHSAEQRKGRQR